MDQQPKKSRFRKRNASRNIAGNNGEIFQEKLGIYIKKELLSTKEPWVVFLNPILGKYNSPIRGHNEDQINERTSLGKEYIEESNLDSCDFVVFPLFFKMDYFNKVKELSKEAKKFNKKVILFYVSDISDNIDIENIIVFRTSIDTQNNDNEYCMPPFPGDALKEFCKGEIKLDSKINKDILSIGYTGYSKFHNTKTRLLYLSLQLGRNIMKIKQIRKLLYNLHKENIYHLLSTIGKGKYIRGKVIKQLEKEKMIKFNFIERKGGLYIQTQKNMKKEYINNINSNNFSLVMRGNGNYSFRLYEVMSLGKIPLFIDTNCRLPLDNIIDYKRLFVWVPIDDLKNINSYIQKYELKNSKNIINIQKTIRGLYQKYLTLNGYFTYIIENILCQRK